MRPLSAALLLLASCATPRPAPAGCDESGPGGVASVGGLQPPEDRPSAWKRPPDTLAVSAKVRAPGRTGRGIDPRLTVQVLVNGAERIAMSWAGDAGPTSCHALYRAELPLAGLAPGVHRWRVRAGDGAAWKLSPEALLLVDPLPALDRVLAANPPSRLADSARERALRDLDACLMSSATAPGGFLDAAAAHGETHRFFRGRLVRALAAPPADHPELVALYNAGLLYRTPTATVGVDVVVPSADDDPPYLPWPPDPELDARLAAGLDLLLVTHGHPDHADRSLMAAVLQAGGQVIAPAAVAALVPGARGLPGDAELKAAGVTVRAYVGRHVYDRTGTFPHLHYEIEPPDGPVLLHTGDGDYVTGLRHSGRVDVLAAKAGGVSPDYDDADPNDRGDDVDAFLLAVQASRPRLALPIHVLELGHKPGAGRETLELALGLRARVEAAGCAYAVPFAGERLDLRDLPAK